MTPLQRRTFALLVFLFAFIFFYEARGERLIQSAVAPAPQKGAELEQHFWEQTLIGAFITAIGAILIFKLRRFSGHVPFTGAELSAYALALGLLIGTAAISWSHVRAQF